MSLCVFQGTFNPIHKIHLKVALFAKEHYGFDKILFIPAYIPPHKAIDNELAQHRLNMVKLAVQDIAGLDVSDIEYKRAGKSYTYLTILELIKQYKIPKGERISFLIGTDAFSKIDTWYEADKLKELLHFVVFPRCNTFKESDFEHLKHAGYDFEFAPMEFVDISSTEIRDNINNGISVNDIEIESVAEYIEKHGLYKLAEK